MGYDVTLAESDLARMVTGLVYGEATGLGIHAGLHYGLSFSFGYYHLLYAVAPAHFLLDPDQAAQLINALGLVFGGLLALSCSLLLEKLFGGPVAAAATISFLGSPVMLPFNISGHPMVAATAVVFFSAWLILLAQERSLWARSILLSLGFFLLTMGLTFRAEIAFAFPFVIALTWLRASSSVRCKIQWALFTSGMCCFAFVVFLILQHAYVAGEGGGIRVLGDFVSSFFRPRRIGQGVAVLILGMGICTLLSLIMCVLSRRFEAPTVRLALVLGGIVAVPSLLFWLPNPFPARHFLFSIFGAYVILSACAEKLMPSIARAILMGMVCILANQFCAELAYPILVRSYNWTDQVLIDNRRPNQSIPLGAFPLNQRANQAKEALYRREAIDFANRNPIRVLFLADTQDYIMSHLLLRDSGLRIEQTSIAGFKANVLANEQRQIFLISKYEQYPKDGLAEILAIPEFATWKIMEQRLSRSRYDKTALPSDRAYDPIKSQ